MLKKQISNALGLDWKRLQLPGAEVKDVKID
jgi:hypothetical protein